MYQRSPIVLKEFSPKYGFKFTEPEGMKIHFTVDCTAVFDVKQALHEYKTDIADGWYESKEEAFDNAIEENLYLPYDFIDYPVEAKETAKKLLRRAIAKDEARQKKRNEEWNRMISLTENNQAELGCKND